MAIDLLYVVSTLRQSGPTNQLYYLLDSLNEDFNARILTLSPEPEDSELHRFRDLDVEYETLGLSRIKGGLVGPHRLRAAVREYQPDVIHTQGIRADTLVALFLSNYPHVTTIRNYAYDDYPAKYGEAKGTVMAFSHLTILKQISYPVACSETIAEKVKLHGINAIAIQNGVDTGAYTPATPSKKIVQRDQLGLPETGPIVVSVGSLIERKDPKTVVRGFFQSSLSERGHLVMLGDGPLRQDCERAVQDDSRVFFKGWVDNVENYLQASDYFVSASKSEGLPNSVMEALASGLPVCLSDIQPHEEILQYGDVGTKFELENISELATALESMDDIGVEAPRTVAIDHLSADRMSQEYQSVYDDIN